MQSSNDSNTGFDFDFDEWVELAKEDPGAFEARRDALLQEAIDQAPLHFRKKLHGLQFQVDMIRERSNHPLGACVRISNLMMDSLFASESEDSKKSSSTLESETQRGTGKSNLIPFPADGAGRRRL